MSPTMEDPPADGTAQKPVDDPSTVTEPDEPESNEVDARFIDDVREAGTAVDDADVKVTIGPDFLELFSEQLYTSPNKTFEELISNSWDAGATDVRISVPKDLSSEDAALWVLDNGESMDVAGFQRLWSVATSSKQTRDDPPRPQIGKFGIGKLATYLLAHQLTYICKAADGKIRVVAMDYRWISDKPGSLHIDPLPLPVREIDDGELKMLLAEVTDAAKLLAEIGALGKGKLWTGSAEFGGVEIAPPDPSGTWTLAILTELKPEGRAVQSGMLERMMRTSLPLGSNFRIHFNGKQLDSSKISVDAAETWVLGPDFPLDELDVYSPDGEMKETLEIVKTNDPVPSIEIAGLGRLSGQVVLYEETISGGKSNLLGASNGFFVNILGRVINPEDPYFGLSNLNHAAWARFRATIRIDGLNDELSVNREGVQEGDKLRTARALLRSMFNHARNTYDAANKANWPDVGQILTDAWGTVPFDPLRLVIEGGLANGDLPAFVSKLEGEPTDGQRESWAEVKSHSDVVKDVRFTPRSADDTVVEYDLEAREIVVNENHPFVREWAGTHEQRLLLRDQAMADLLTSAYMSSVGVDEATMGQVALYRDQLLRLLARLRRRSGTQIAEMLELAAKHEKDKALEVILGDALEAIGFVVERMGGSGKPEGVAVAPLSPKKTEKKSLYSFTYDAKSSAKNKVKTGNVGSGGLARHRVDFNADYTMVVGPNFEDGALQAECEQQKITPIKVVDLGRLVVATTQYGPLDLTRLQGVFDLYDPDAVTKFVDLFLNEVAATKILTYTQIFEALDEIGFDSPDMLTTPVIAKTIRDREGGGSFPTKADVAKVLLGMQVLTPQLIRVQGDNVFLGARPDKFREAILAQIQSVPAQFKAPPTKDGS